ncbi:MAG: biotin--[acetyl-CoA-carboxylase] ligase [Eubacterium sp.]|jgi:biotin--[acetyl-coA-carboxylase] ligase|uniref:biotin--[acetyl-CoA-carboxylase] ligase n=1 Tax=Eubacterium sp. TaxID=142586 RepID=UPI003993F6AE
MSVKDEVLKELENNKGDYISGGQLADNLGVSRNSVWKAIKALEKSGYEINAIPNKGYCLAEKNDILSSYSIKQHLKNPHLDISVFSSVTSTNTILKEMAEQGAKEGTVIIAEEQTAGRGRTGKQFYSPKGTGIYISILLRPDIPAEESLFLTTSAAVATARAIEDVSDKRALIKWVNDIYLEDKKACGILTEGAFNVETGKLDYAIVGIGINVCIPDGGFPDNIKDIATAIFDKQTDSINKRSILIANLLDYFMEYYKDFKSKSYVKEYIERSMIIGKTITVIEGSKTSVAKAIDIDKNCRLKVQFENGTTKWLSSGEVSTKIHK